MNFTKNRGVKKYRNSGTEFDFGKIFGTERNGISCHENGTELQKMTEFTERNGTVRNGIYLY